MYQTYTVKKGDTLYGISNQFGVSVTELAELNNIRGSNLNIGQVLKIPLKSGENPNNLFIYTVKAGDTLYKIAQKYKTTIKAIMDLNYLKTSDLKVGQELRIPETYTKEEEMTIPNYVNYTVKKGDSLYQIAKNNNLSVETIIQDNALATPNLSIGQVLKLRKEGSNEILEVEECIGPDYTPKESQNVTNYVVKKGDNLYTIARQFGTSETVIMNLNNLSNTNLAIGQTLKIPLNQNIQTYTVKKGDSLYAIASKFKTTVASLKSKNNLTTNNLQVGQVLKI